MGFDLAQIWADGRKSGKIVSEMVFVAALQPTAGQSAKRDFLSWDCADEKALQIAYLDGAATERESMISYRR